MYQLLVLPTALARNSGEDHLPGKGYCGRLSAMVTEERKLSMRHRVLAMTVVVAALLLTWGLATVTAVPVQEGLPTGAPASQASRDARRAEVQSLLPAVRGASLTASATPVPQIEVMLGAVVSATLAQTVGDLSGEWPVLIEGQWYTITTRNTYSGGPIEKAVAYAGERFAEMGLDVEYHRWNASVAPNVIAELEGALYPEEVVILSAHLDSYNRDSTSELAPGADDNASGVAAVLAGAEILSDHAWGRTLRFALWTGEEQGTLGSQVYARRSSGLGEEILAVVNLDMIGWDGVGEPDMDLHANQDVLGSLTLAELFSDVVRLYDLELVPEIIAEGTNRSDHASFWNEGYAAVLGIEDFYPSYYHDFNPYYHTDQDRLAYLDLDYVTEMARAAVGTVAHLGCLVENGPCRWQWYLPLVVRAIASR